MTRFEQMETYIRECYKTAQWRKRCDDPADADRWVERAQETERMLQSEKADAMVKAAVARVEKDAEAKMAAAIEVSRQAWDRLGDWFVERGMEHEDVILDTADEVEDLKKSRVEEIAKSAEPKIITTEAHFTPSSGPLIGGRDPLKPGRIEYVDVLENDRLIARRWPTYDARGRLTGHREERF